jgi:hypothetical protein
VISTRAAHVPPGNARLSPVYRNPLLCSRWICLRATAVCQRPNVGGKVHNVLFVATEHDSVYAFDADQNQQLWKASLLDTATKTLYVVSQILEKGAWGKQAARPQHADGY